MLDVMIRAGTNTPSDEYDSYREYRVANTNMYSRIQWFAYSLVHARVKKKFYSAEVLFGKHMWVIKTETPIKTCNVLLAWEPPFKKI